jgi:hypothetical protein
LTTYFCWPNKFPHSLPTSVGPTNHATYFFPSSLSSRTHSELPDAIACASRSRCGHGGIHCGGPSPVAPRRRPSLSGAACLALTASLLPSAGHAHPRCSPTAPISGAPRRRAAMAPMPAGLPSAASFSRLGSRPCSHRWMPAPARGLPDTAASSSSCILLWREEH